MDGPMNLRSGFILYDLGEEWNSPLLPLPSPKCTLEGRETDDWLL